MSYQISKPPKTVCRDGRCSVPFEDVMFSKPMPEAAAPPLADDEAVITPPPPLDQSVRTNFQPVAAFLPQTVVGENGEATMTFRLPDNIGNILILCFKFCFHILIFYTFNC